MPALPNRAFSQSIRPTSPWPHTRAMHIALPNSPELWPIAQLMLTQMMRELGAPGIVAAAEQLTHQLRRAILMWLAPMECFVRKLLLIEAAKHPRPADPLPPRDVAYTLKQSLAQRTRKTRIVVTDPNRPATWRVSFRVPLPPCPTRRKDRSAQGPRIVLFGELVTTAQLEREHAERLGKLEARREKIRANALKRLAMRYEALRRVIDDPTRAIARLALRLTRNPRAALRLAKTRWPTRTRKLDQHAIVIVQDQAETSATAFTDSS